MAAFVKWMAENEGRLHPVEFAALVHQKFVYVHPFVDGNGRVARLLMNLALLRAGWAIAIIPPICRHDYIAALDKAGRLPAPFVLFVRDRVIETQRELLRLMGQSIGIDSEKAYPAALSSATDSPHVSCNPMHSRIAVILSMPECADEMIREYD